MNPLKFINTVNEIEPEMARREYITRNVLFISFIVTSSFTLISVILYILGKMPIDTLLIYLVLSIILVAAMFLAEAGFWRFVGIIPPLLMYFPAVNANYIGGIDAPGNFMYALLIIFVAIIYGHKRMWIALVICLSTYLCLAWMISSGYIKPFRTAEVVFTNRVVLTSGFLVGIALMIWLLGRSYRIEIDVRIKVEELLNKKNEELGGLNEALRKSEERYKSLIENANEIILVIQDGMIKFVNSKATESFGYSEQEILSIPVFELIHPENREVVRERYLQKIGGDTTATRYVYRMIRKSGQTFWIEISSVLIDWEGRGATLNLITNVTERLNAEEEKVKLEERLNRAEKMEALGHLAGGVAHDLNNVLGVLSGYSELLLMQIPEGQKGRNHVEKILQSTEKGAAIIQDLLTLARRGVMASDVINLNSVVLYFLTTPVTENIKNYHPSVTFKTEYQDDLLNIKGSSVHLEKTLMNLVSNAAESISGHGEVTIRTENCYLDKPIRGYDEIKEGDYAILTVSDTGMGIPAEHIENIFEPFYTKKIMGRSGTGLGLAIVWGTVKDHNGYIDVQTKVGEGTTFTLYFPVTREMLTSPQQKLPIEQYMGKGESILVVDDIAEQREVASGLLKKLGYEVHAVSSGEEAVEYLKGNKADLLVLDMIMTPGIDGLETYQRILEINPKQKAILVSGFSETTRVRKAQKLGAGAYVKKPYVMEKIGVAIRDELNR